MSEAQTIVGGRDAAVSVGLTYASSEGPGLSRRRAGKGFSYRTTKGEVVTDKMTLKRIRALAIPPAWTGVWICPDTNGHIQAVGFDEKGRKQYRYHVAFREVREGAKFKHLMIFAAALPELRRQLARDIAKPGVGREKVIATVVELLEKTMIRVGNAAYATQNGSYGLTTLLNRHVKVAGTELKFHFRGKSGKIWRLSLNDRRVARTVKSCQDLPGQHLFQYVDDAGNLVSITSADVNDYLKQASGAEITAKDFRTWNGTVLAAVALCELEAAESLAGARKNLSRAIETVAARLGNTPTICRKCYIHPEILSAYLEGSLSLELQGDDATNREDEPGALRPEEAAVVTLLRTRLAGDPALNADTASTDRFKKAERRRRTERSRLAAMRAA